jgi:hypothetical protein
VDHQQREHEVVAGHELGAGEDDHHQAERNAEPAKHQVVLARRASEPAADLRTHGRAQAEEETAEQGQEEELEVAVLSLLLAGGEELLEHLRVGELRATRQVHRDRAGLDAGHVCGRRRCVWTVRRRSAAARCLWRGKVDAVEVTRVRVRGGVARPTARFALSNEENARPLAEKQRGASNFGGWVQRDFSKRRIFA